MLTFIGSLSLNDVAVAYGAGAVAFTLACLATLVRGRRELARLSPSSPHPAAMVILIVAAAVFAAVVWPASLVVALVSGRDRRRTPAAA